MRTCSACAVRSPNQSGLNQVFSPLQRASRESSRQAATIASLASYRSPANMGSPGLRGGRTLVLVMLALAAIVRGVATDETSSDPDVDSAVWMLSFPSGFLAHVSRGLCSEAESEEVTDFGGTCYRTISFPSQHLVLGSFSHEDLQAILARHGGSIEAIHRDSVIQLDGLDAVVGTDERADAGPEASATEAGPARGLRTGASRHWWLDVISGGDEDALTSLAGAETPVNVYVLDTGVDATHPEFQTASGTRVKCAYSVDAGATTGPGAMNRFRDCDGHGTHVASLVAGNTVGVNPHATVYSLKVFPQCSSQTSASNLLGALAWLEWNFRPPGVVVMSMWQPNGNELVAQALQRLIQLGAAIVAAAGNNTTSYRTLLMLRLPLGHSRCHFRRGTGREAAALLPVELGPMRPPARPRRRHPRRLCRSVPWL